MTIVYLIKKEILETWRTRSILIIGIVFIIFGILNPLAAKLTPEILKMGLKTEISLPKPTSLEAWMQFYKNITQIGIYLFAIIFSGIVSRETVQGTLINLVTKGLTRYKIIISKWLVLFAQWVLCCGLCFLVTWGYTQYYFPDDMSPHILFAFLPVLGFGLFLTSTIVLSSTIMNHNYGGLLGTIALVILLNVLNLFKSLHHFNPISLITNNLKMVQDIQEITVLWPSFWITGGATSLFLFLAIYGFNRKKL